MVPRQSGPPVGDAMKSPLHILFTYTTGGGTCHQYLIALAAACCYEVEYLSVEVASRLQTEYVEHVGELCRLRQWHGISWFRAI